jgi:O-antigen ligase
MLARAQARDQTTPSPEPTLAAAPTPQAGWIVKAMVVVAWAGLVVMPLAVTPGMEDTLVMAKEIVFAAQGLLALLLLTLAVVFDGTGRLRQMARNRPVTILVGAILAWTVVTTALSTHRRWSMESATGVLLAVLLFLLVWYAAPRIPPAILDSLVGVAAINTVIVFLQDRDIWEPFPLEWQWHHLGNTGLIGNPNFLGSYLSIAAAVMGACAVVYRGWRRWLYVAGTLIAIAGLVVSQTRTGLIALGATIVITALWRSWRQGLIATLLVALGLWAGAAAQVPAVTRLISIPDHARQGRWDSVFSERFPPFLAAVEMFEDRPLFGLGPGTFKYHYMAYRVELPAKYPAAIASGNPVNFAETHNDHLQFLAEAGIPGYALFLAALVVLARGWRRLDGSGPLRQRLAHAIGFSSAALTFILCLAQFPLQLSVTQHLLVTAAGIAIGWRE